MKKIILSLVMALVLIVATSCSLQSGDTIKFTSLPQPVYTQGYSEEAFKKEVKVSINGYETSLDSAEGVVIAGLDFQTVGSHTLVVVYNSASLTFDYEVVASLTTTKVADETQLREALDNENVSVIELTEDITSNQRFVINKATTIYGNGYTIKVTETGADSRAITIDNVDYNSVAFYDLNIVHVDNVGGETRGVTLAKCEYLVLTIDNCSIFNERYYAINITPSNSNVTVNMKNGSTAGGYCAINNHGESCVFNVMDSTLLGQNIHGYGESNSFATIVAYSNSSTFNFKNVNVKASSLQGNIEWLVQLSNVAQGNVLNFDNCTFEYAVVNGEECPFANRLNDNEIYINGELLK